MRKRRGSAERESSLLLELFCDIFVPHLVFYVYLFASIALLLRCP